MSTENEAPSPADMDALLGLMQSMQKQIEDLKNGKPQRAKPTHISPRKTLKGRRGIGGIVEKMRVEKNLNQTDFAKLIGMDNTHLSVIEKKDDYNCRIQDLQKIAKGFGIPASVLLSRMEARDMKMSQT